MMSVDIIIPIYNAFDDLQICLQSIYKNTDLQKNRLILINDKSPDERIRPYLDEQIGHISDKTGLQDNIIVIHNETNKGFSNNINLGMEQSAQNDVILLNSDTIVTRNWVEKMVACAYSDGSIGTVTPVSNNATLCSVPNFCEENMLPEGMTVERAAEIVEECSMKKYPRITVAHGFCMLVKREVIDCIGKFDAETFGRGYGEENDFCNRAEQMGYIHVMCDDTYIYHSGTKSFVSKEKEAYIREHDRILQERYPAQMHNNAVHCRDNPNGWVGNHIELGLELYNGKKNIFYLLQADFRDGADNNIGGTQLHVKHLCNQLREGNNIFVAARDEKYLQVTAYTEKKEYVFRYFIGEQAIFPVLHDRDFAILFRNLLNVFKIDIVHVHHTATTSLDIFEEARKLQIPTYFSIHDFFSLCPNEKLLDSNDCICDETKIETKKCKKCLCNKKGIVEGRAFLDKWQTEYEKALSGCKLIFAPSQSARDIFVSNYKRLENKIIVLEHGLDEVKQASDIEYTTKQAQQVSWEILDVRKKKPCIEIKGAAYFEEERDKRRKVYLKVTDCKGNTLFLPTTYEKNMDIQQVEKKFYCYLPNAQFVDGDIEIIPYVVKDGIYYTNYEEPYVIKDVQFLNDAKMRVAFIGGINKEKGSEIVTQTIKKGDKNIEWYVFGGIGDENLYRLKQDNLTQTGFYYQEDIGSLLKHYMIDAICILSIWSETFSYTLSEAVLNQLPVVVLKYGALGQRVRDNGWGSVVNPEDGDTGKQINDVLCNWMEHRESYNEVRKRLSGYIHKSVAEMAKEYEQLYTTKEKHTSVKEMVQEKEFVYSGLRTNDIEYEGNAELIDKINKLQNQLGRLDNSVTFKIVQAIVEMRIPGREKIRKILLKMSMRNAKK